MATARRHGMNEVIETFGDSTRDYTDPATWEAVWDIDLVTIQQSPVLECYRDANSFDVSINFSGATTSEHFFRIIRAAPGYKHGGNPNDGVKFASTANTDCINFAEAHSGAYDLVIDLSGSSAGGLRAVDFTGTGGSNKAIGLLVIQATNSGAGSAQGFNISGNDAIMVNCVAANADGDGFLFSAGTDAIVYNCVAHGNGDKGFDDLTSADKPTLINCIGSSNVGEDFDSVGFTATSDFNAATDATAPDNGNSRQSQTLTYVNPTSNDFRLSTLDSGARNFGTDLSGDTTFPFSDSVEGHSFSTWDIGMSEPEPATITSAPRGPIVGKTIVIEMMQVNVTSSTVVADLHEALPFDPGVLFVSASGGNVRYSYSEGQNPTPVFGHRLLNTGALVFTKPMQIKNFRMIAESVDVSVTMTFESQ